MPRVRRCVPSSPSLALLCALVPWLAAAPAVADSETGWPQLRGVDQTGSVAGSGLAERQAFGLKRSWHRPLGSGYSGVVALGERAVTMFSDGPDDVLAAFDAGSSDEIWRYRIGDRYAAAGGSYDGPLSTPILAGGRVYALSPEGRVLAVQLSDGRELWSRQLEEASEARKPFFGFSTAPVLAGDEAVAKLPATDRAAAVDRLLEGRSLPWIEGEDLVHFLFRGEAEDVAVAGLGLVEGESQVGLRRIDGTDLWARSVRVDQSARRMYRFVVDYDDLRPDPANAHQHTVGEQTYSELRMPAWRLAAHQQPAEGATGRSEELTLEKGVFEQPRTVRVYLPAGYSEGDGAYPLLIVLDGERAATGLGLENALDRLSGSRLEPMIVAVVGPQGRNEYRRESATVLRYLENDLLPALEKRYRLAEGPRNRALWGRSFGGYMALYAALSAPETFGGAVAQGYYAHADRNAELIEMVSGELPADLRLYVDWSRWDNTARAEKLAAALDAAERSWSGGRVDGTSEWHDLAGRIDQPLAVLFPAGSP